MGLDMFLKTSDKDLAERMYYLNVKHGRVKDCDFEYESAMRGEICYWRKQSSIHNFFVEQIQNGVDDCGIYDVDLGTLKDLYNRVKKVLETGDDSDLPTVDGFFFNVSDNGSWIRNGLEYTKGFLEDLLNEIIEVNGYIYYKRNYFPDSYNWDARIEYYASW
uniref:Uncharacterized protein n=1 Tax=Siphoviridae sp. ctZHD14 TaxID=2827891 RepID=A0A8S5SWZ9_9CAUD|nr:MAG TPA: hypothetical protein [Siphoviridae sp. ctZHD14]